MTDERWVAIRRIVDAHPSRHELERKRFGLGAK
jgi:hypothetical protein